jgi:glutamyl-tRNA synthetase
VLMRSDGVPLYNLGCVVDDITMGITMVARGRDHMINTPVQVLLYQALGAKPPQFAHLPLMLGKGGEKLSKRHGAVSVGEYRQGGFKPAGLLNYLVRFGWSFGDEEVFDLEELVAKFDWSRCNRSDGKFDAAKLLAINFEHLKEERRTNDEAYLERWLPFLEAQYGAADATLAHAALPHVRPRARTLLEATEMVGWLFSDELVFEDKAKRKFLTADKASLLEPLAALVGAIEPFEAEALERAVKTWAEREQLSLGAIAQPARVALTGRGTSPGLFDVMHLLGRERTLARLERGRQLAEA